MGNLIQGILLCAAIIGFLTILRCIRTLRTLNRHAESAWAQLTSLLDQRHLLITRLVNASGDWLGRQAGEVATACEAARAALQTGGKEFAMPKIDLISDRERNLQHKRDGLIESIAQTDDLKRLEVIRNCVEGLEALDTEIKVARVNYNDAAITHTTFINTRLASWVVKISRQPKRYRMIDSFSTASGVESSNVPPYQSTEGSGH